MISISRDGVSSLAASLAASFFFPDLVLLFTGLATGDAAGGVGAAEEAGGIASLFNHVKKCSMTTR